jgi:MATE family multidrug resistance protein
VKPVRNGDILRLAGPLLVTNAIQAILNLTDVWFLGRLSTEAVAAISAIYWIVSCVTMLLAGVSLIVQSFVSQAVGARRLHAASAAAWSGMWAALGILPLAWLLAWSGPWLVASLGLTPSVAQLALEFWQPRMLGLPIGMCAWALMSFFNGCGATRKTLAMVATAVLVNIPGNQWLIFDAGLGMRGSAWATNIAQAASLAVGLLLFLARSQRQRYASQLTFRFRPKRVWRMWRSGMPVGVMYGADLIGVALFQIMVAQASVPGAAATQIVMTLTSLAYQPTMGIASAGSILVGQAIGGRDLDYARRIGNRSILLCVACMVIVAFCLIAGSQRLIPLFLGSQDAAADAALVLALQIVWIAAAYQAFDGLYFGSGFALRAAGDTRVPALTALLLSWCFFVPLAQSLVFTREQAWVPGLPQFGFGAVGGWAALCCYAMLLGSSMLWRWRAGRWQVMRLR